jgi:DNA-binding PadR family transcriptional regulator
MPTPPSAPRALDALLPLKAIEFEVLLALHGGELHGYGLAKAIEARTTGRLRLEPANLYRRLHRLVEGGLVEASGRRRASDAADERRRYFRITPHGRDILKAEALRLQDQVQAAAALRIVPRLEKAR